MLDVTNQTDSCTPATVPYRYRRAAHIPFGARSSLGPRSLRATSSSYLHCASLAFLPSTARSQARVAPSRVRTHMAHAYAPPYLACHCAQPEFAYHASADSPAALGARTKEDGSPTHATPLRLTVVSLSSLRLSLLGSPKACQVVCVAAPPSKAYCLAGRRDGELYTVSRGTVSLAACNGAREELVQKEDTSEAELRCRD